MNLTLISKWKKTDRWWRAFLLWPNFSTLNICWGWRSIREEEEMRKTALNRRNFTSLHEKSQWHCCYWHLNKDTTNVCTIYNFITNKNKLNWNECNFQNKKKTFQLLGVNLTKSGEEWKVSDFYKSKRTARTDCFKVRQALHTGS
jgi:hypothetical protein